MRRRNMKNKTYGIITITILCIISILILSNFIYLKSEKTISHYVLLKNISLIYILFYLLVSIFYVNEIFKYGVLIKHKYFIYGQLFNITSFYVIANWLFTLSIENEVVNTINKFIGSLLFPGQYFINYFKCLEPGWNCSFFDLYITLFFNTIIFTTLGFILGIILNFTHNGRKNVKK